MPGLVLNRHCFTSPSQHPNQERICIISINTLSLETEVFGVARSRLLRLDGAELGTDRPICYHHSYHLLSTRWLGTLAISTNVVKKIR